MSRVLVIGAGSWGSRVAGTMRRPSVEVSTVDPANMLATFAALDYAIRAELRPTHVVVAVPPSEQRRAALAALEAFESITDLRLEKPGGDSREELLDIVAAADRCDVQVSVGYTLAAEAGHQLARAIAREAGGVDLVRCVRTSPRGPRHRVSAMLDLGSHAAYLAHAAGAEEADILVAHDAGIGVRITSYRTGDGFEITVDEQARRVTCPDLGIDETYPEGNPLRIELEAFLEGAPLVGADDALDVWEILERERSAAWAK